MGVCVCVCVLFFRNLSTMKSLIPKNLSFDLSVSFFCCRIFSQWLSVSKTSSLLYIFFVTMHTRTVLCGLFLFLNMCVHVWACVCKRVLEGQKWILVYLLNIQVSCLLIKHTGLVSIHQTYRFSVSYGKIWNIILLPSYYLRDLGFRITHSIFIVVTMQVLSRPKGGVKACNKQEFFIVWHKIPHFTYY